MRPTRKQNVYGRTVRIETVVDLAPPDQVWTINDNTQFLETYAALTWTGRRRYMFEDGPKWVLRRDAQVMSPGHLATLKRLTATHNHPTVRGEPVNITTANAGRFSVGSTGDAIDSIEIQGYTVPASGVSVNRTPTIVDIQGGASQTSLGYVAMIDTTGGTWDGPHGPESFDFEHVLDPLDPRVLELVDATKDDEQPFLAGTLGGNHFAVGIRHGRGAALSELMSPVRDGTDDLFRLAANMGHVPASQPCRVFMYRDAAGIDPEPLKEEKPVPTKTKITFACDSLDVEKRSITVEDLSPEVAEEFAAFLREINATSSALLAQLGEAKMAEQEQQAVVESAQAAQTVAEGAQAEAVAETAEMQDSLTKAQAKVTELESVLNPSDDLVKLREAAKTIHDADYSRLDAEGTKRAAVVGRSKDAKHEKSPAVVVEALFDTFVNLPSKPEPQKPKAKAHDFSGQRKAVHDKAPKTGGTLARINNRRASA